MVPLRIVLLFRCGTPPFQFFVQTDTENFVRGEEVVDTLFQTVCINVFAEVRNIGYLLLGVVATSPTSETLNQAVRILLGF